MESSWMVFLLAICRISHCVLSMELNETKPILSSLVPQANNSSCLSELDLWSFLFSDSDYTSSVRPVRDALKPIDVTLGLSLIRLNDILEREQLMSIVGYIHVEWSNEYLVWQNIPEFRCIDELTFKEGEIWLPDVSLTNSGDIYDLLLSSGHKVQVTSDGHAVYEPAKQIQVFCELDLTYFPFDKQICELHFESWLYTVQYQTFNITETPVTLMHYRENDQWWLKATSGETERIAYEDPNQFYDRVNFVLHLQRKVAYYSINVIAPSIIIAFVELVIFMLPTVEIEKVPISFTCLLAYSVFQLMINDDMPRTSDHTPMLSYYIVLQMAYLSVAIIGQGFVFLCIWMLEQVRPVPPKLYAAFRVAGRIVRVSEEDDESPEQNHNLASACETLDRRHHSIHVVMGDLNNGGMEGSGGGETVFTNYVRRLTAIVEERDALERHNRRQSSHRLNKVAVERTRTDASVAESSFGAVLDEILDEPNELLQSQQPSTSNQAFLHVPLRKQASNKSRGGGENSTNATLAREMLDRIVSARHHAVIKAQWLFIAEVIDRCILLVYLLGITITPIVIFGIMPNI